MKINMIMHPIVTIPIEDVAKEKIYPILGMAKVNFPITSFLSMG